MHPRFFSLSLHRQDGQTIPALTDMTQMKQIFRVVAQGEAYAVQSQKAENSTRLLSFSLFDGLDDGNEHQSRRK